MSAPVIAAQVRTRTVSGVQALVAAAVLGLAVVITLGAIAAWSSRPPANGDAAVRDAHYGVGYPLHGGLAGPSRVSAGLETVDGSRYGAGYPLHGGLAGPSRVTPIIQTVEGNAYGAGYPLHGGLAGPSRVATVMQTPEGNVFAWANEIGDGR